MTESVIDFDWERPPKDIEEISDVPALEEGVIVLKDPAVQRAERIAAKKAVREAYYKAHDASALADKLAHEFMDKYDLSENESVFSGLEDDSSEDEAAM